ncbi:MAG TPA: DUF4280 domain-containing protein [Firmicutes bacterium]|jgi:hypothetical protein|nr:DUF4280 domain-containing protein [Bacillota bacterium]
MANYAVSGAKLKCSYGDQNGSLKVMDHKVQAGGKPMANITDFKPNVNISAFGNCSSLANPTVAAATAANEGRLQKMPCIPATCTPWMGAKNNVLIGGAAALLNSSKTCCIYGGQISISDCGQ